MHEATRYILDHAEELRAEALRATSSAGSPTAPVEILRASGGHEAAPGQGLRWLRGAPERLHGLGHGRRR